MITFVFDVVVESNEAKIKAINKNDKKERRFCFSNTAR